MHGPQSVKFTFPDSASYYIYCKMCSAWTFLCQLPEDWAAEPLWQNDQFVIPLYIYSHVLEMCYTNKRLAKKYKSGAV